MALLVSVLLIVSALFVVNAPLETNAFSKSIVKRGAKGADVREMQYRLKHLGFYTGPVNGSFTTRTYNALRNFQYEDEIEAVQCHEKLPTNCR